MNPPRLLDAIEPGLRGELLRRIKSRMSLVDADRFCLTHADLDEYVRGEGRNQLLAGWVVNRFIRPSLPIDDGKPATSQARFWQRRLALSAREIERASWAVGRIELHGHPGLRWAGNCWLIAAGIAVTTGSIGREVAQVRSGLFASGGRRSEGESAARVRFQSAVVDVKDVLALKGAPGAELAFLSLEAVEGMPEPLSLSVDPPKKNATAVGIGYVASDSRARHPLVQTVYADTIDRKCAAPGRLLAFEPGKPLLHDCATVGNSAAALMLDLNTGQALGIHVAGALDGPGAGVTSLDIRDTLLEVGVPPQPATREIASVGEDLEARRRTAQDYADRVGYDSGFLGEEIPPPKATDAICSDVLEFEDAPGRTATLLPYEHFSVCMSKSRRMCLFTACNVEGGDLKDLVRTGTRWLFDPRIDVEFQAGDELYRKNDLDRGHMVRRLDPVWGESAERANEDTFHFTNSCPQHKDLNQKTWNDLEDYVLQNAGTHRLKLNVFTGPVFRDEDPAYRDFRLPLEFWKVVVMIKRGGDLSATAYVLSQADRVTGLEFAFGEFRTYQVPLVDVEEWTNLEFGKLRDFDPKKGHEALESTARFVPIESAADLQL